MHYESTRREIKNIKGRKVALVIYIASVLAPTVLRILLVTGSRAIRRVETC